MDEFPFTLEQLKKTNKKGLIKIARYYEILVSWKQKKAEIIRVIWEAFNPPEVEIIVEKSVRIRRIQESSK